MVFLMMLAMKQVIHEASQQRQYGGKIGRQRHSGSIRKLGHTKIEPLEGVGLEDRVTQPLNSTGLAARPLSINWFFVELNVVNSG